MSNRHLLAALACAGILSATGAVQAAQAAPPANVQKAKAERKAAHEAAKQHKRTCAAQDLSSAFGPGAHPYNSPVPVRCTDGYPAELEISDAADSGYQGFEVANHIDHDGPLFIYFGDQPQVWLIPSYPYDGTAHTTAPEFTWYDGETGQLPPELLDQKLRLAYYDVHGDLVAWQWLTMHGWN